MSPKYFIAKVSQRLRRIVLRVLFPNRIPVSEIKNYLWSVLPVKTKNRHQEITLLRSEDQGQNIPRDLLSVAAEAAALACDLPMDFVQARFQSKRELPAIDLLLASGWSANQWPGEHYRLLSSLCRVLKAKNVVEIGTFWGAGSLALRDGVGPDGRVTTFDVIPWHGFPETILLDSDFGRGLCQIVGDLQDPAVFEQHRSIFEGADVIFMDAAKDGVMERVFLAQFARCCFKPHALLVVDDIRLWNMLDIWDEIRLPKLDMTCFGHYTGTGLVKLNSEVI